MPEPAVMAQSSGVPGELAFHPLANLFPLIEGQAFDELVEDIRANGIREPIVLHEGKILDGRNRYRAGLKSGVIASDGQPNGSPVQQRAPKRWFLESEGDPLAFVLSRNLHRRHLTTSQRAMIGAEIAGMRRGRPGDNPPYGGFSVSDAAARLNIAERSIERARVVRDHGADEVIEAVRSGTLTVAAASDLAALPKEKQRDAILSADVDVLYKVIAEQRAIKQAAKAEKREAREQQLGARIAAGNAALDAMAQEGRRFGVILADPEWKFEPWSQTTGMDRAPENHYPTTPTRVIASRPVGALAAPDCVLFLWATAPMLYAAHDVITGWGFRYQTHCIWLKRRPGQARGPGYWFTGEHEILLLATRGSPPAPAPGQQWRSAFVAPIGGHSEKPERAYELIESYFPTLPKLELNARRRRPGWELWGAEAPDHLCESIDLDPSEWSGRPRPEEVDDLPDAAPEIELPALPRRAGRAA